MKLSLRLTILFFFSFSLFGVVAADDSDDNPYAPPTPVKNWEYPPEYDKVRMEEMLHNYTLLYEGLYQSWNPHRLFPAKVLPYWFGFLLVGAGINFFAEQYSLVVFNGLVAASGMLHVARLYRISDLARKIARNPSTKPTSFYVMDAKFSRDCEGWENGFLK